MRPIVFLLLFLFSGLQLTSAQTEWKIDPSHSSMQFSVRHMLITNVVGKFDNYDIKFKSGDEDFANSEIGVTIQVKSINTDNEKRDEHLRSDDFFAADEFPTLTFKANEFKKVSDNKYKLIGDLTMRGTTKRVELDALFIGKVNDPWGNTRVGFEVKGSVNRFDYGLKWNNAIETGGLVVGETVNITANVQFIKQS